MKNTKSTVKAGPAKAGIISKGESAMTNLIKFQVLKNLAYAADVSAAKLVRHQGISKKTGAEYDFEQYETPIMVDGIQVGTITSSKFMPKSRLHNGVRTVSQMYSWTFKEWQSVTLDEVQKEFGDPFWSGTSVNEDTGKTHEKEGYSKKDGSKEITVWVYKDLGNKKDGTYRAQIVLKYIDFKDCK